MKRVIVKPTHGAFKETKKPESKEDSKMLEPIQSTDSEAKQVVNEMELEEKEPVNIDEEYNKRYTTQRKTVDLSDKNPKEKKKYDIEDTVIKDVTLNGDIHVRFLSNINGYFVDIRKFNRGYPTQKGIRFLASKFALAAEMLKDEIDKYVPA